MKCPTCVRGGQKSIVYAPLAGLTTDMGWLPYYDEEGCYHSHNPNDRTYRYECSRGHHWIDADYGSCWCGWRGGPGGK